MIHHRLQEACDPTNAAALGAGSCFFPCPGFLESPDPRGHAGVRQRGESAAGADFPCPSWAGLLRYLVDQGQLEVAGGGWVSHDEALTSPRGALDQLTLGRRALLALGLRPPGVAPGGSAVGVSWQVDTFGHSATTAALLQGLGYSGHIANRVHHQTKAALRAAHALEFEWEVAGRCGGGGKRASEPPLLTVVLDEHYSSPQGLDFEHTVLSRSGRPLAGAVAQAVAGFGETLRRRALAHRTELQLLPMGDDFRFEHGAAANRQFAMLDALVSRAATEALLDVYGVQAVGYSTPRRYMAALQKHRSSAGDHQNREVEAFPSFWARLLPGVHHAGFLQRLPIFRAHDFFPYADRFNNDWSGFYGSRPLLKRVVRRVEGLRATAEVAFAIAMLHGDSDDEAALIQSPYENLAAVREAEALLLHHDAITGTCQPRVARDYLLRGIQAMRLATVVLENSLGILGGLGGTTGAEHRQQAGSNNAGKVMSFNVFNPVAKQRTSVVQTSLPECDSDWVVFHEVLLPDGSVNRSYLLSQLSPPDMLEKEAGKGKGERKKDCDLFVEVDIKPLGALQIQVAPIFEARSSSADFANRAVRSKERKVQFSANGTTEHQFVWDVMADVSRQFSASFGGPIVTLNGWRRRSPRMGSLLRGGTDVEDGPMHIKASIRAHLDKGATVVLELREYLSSDGVGHGWGWGSSSGAYVFRTLLPALFGIGVAIFEGYIFGLCVSIALISLVQRRRKKPKMISRKDYSSQPMPFQRGLLIRRTSDGRRGSIVAEDARANSASSSLIQPVSNGAAPKCETKGRSGRFLFLFILVSAYSGHELAKETLSGQLDSFLFDDVSRVQSSPAVKTDDMSRKMSGNQLLHDDADSGNARGRSLSSFQLQQRFDARASGVTTLVTSAALVTTTASLLSSVSAGALIVPVAVGAYLVTLHQGREEESRPLLFRASSLDHVATVSEGPVLSRLLFAHDGAAMKAAQAIVVEHHLWRTTSDAAGSVEVVTAASGEASRELVARFASAPSSGGACLAFSDDGVKSHPLPISTWWDSISASYVPLRAMAGVRCGDDSPSFTVTAFSPSGVRGTARAAGLEVMLHRSLRLDDEKGLKIPLIDPSRAELHHLISFGRDDVAVRRARAVEYATPVIMLPLRRSAAAARPPMTLLKPSFSLPPFVILMSLQWWPTAAGGHARGGSGPLSSPPVAAGVALGVPAINRAAADSGQRFRPAALELSSVRHPRAKRVMFARFQHLGGPDPTGVARASSACPADVDAVDIAKMFEVPRGRHLCAVVRSSLDFTRPVLGAESTMSTSSRKTPSMPLELRQGEISAVVLSFCE